MSGVPFDWATDCPDDFAVPVPVSDVASRVYALDAETRARFEKRAA